LPPYICRVYSLVGGNKYKLLGFIFYCKLGNQLGTSYIHPEGLMGLTFHYRNMLVGCSMKHNLGPVPAEYELHLAGIGNVSDNYLAGAVRIFFPELVFPGNIQGLCLINKDQPSAPNLVSCLTISEPMDPAAPVTRIVLSESPALSFQD
jgi:hypothetical protein